MSSVRVRLRFRANPDRVFAHISDHVRFFGGFPIRSVRIVRPGATERDGLGALREIRGPGIDFVEEIVVFERPSAYEYRVRRINIPARHEFGRLDFLPVGAGTEVVWRTRYFIRIPLLGLLIGSLFVPIFVLTFWLLLHRARAEVDASQDSG